MWNAEFGFDIGTPVEYFNGDFDEKFEKEPSYVSSKLEPPNYLTLR